MAGHLRVVDGQLRARVSGYALAGDEPVGETAGFEERRERFEVVARDVPAVGARIGGEFEFVEVLQRLERACGGHAVQPAHVLLQSGQVIQAGRPVIHPLPAHGHDAEAAAFDLAAQQHRRVLAVDPFAGEPPSAHVRDHGPERHRLVASYLPVAFRDHGERRRLHAAHAEPCVVEQRVRAARVHAGQPVRLRPDLRRPCEPPVFGFGFHRPPRGLDGLRLQARHPQAQFRLARAFHVRDAAEDGLALAVWVAGVDEAIHVRAADQLHDLPVPGAGTAFGADLPLPMAGRVHRQRVQAPFAPIPVLVVLWHGEVDQVALRPCHEQLAALIASVPLDGRGAQRLRDGRGDRFLFRDDESHSRSFRFSGFLDSCPTCEGRRGNPFPAGPGWRGVAKVRRRSRAAARTRRRWQAPRSA